ncbi:MAG: UbiA family prenyltransferase [Massilia sp.]
MSRAHTTDDLPLVVGLDGTLIHSDMLFESLLAFLRTRLLQWWRLPLWLCGGMTLFRHKLSQAVHVDPAGLPYDRVLLAQIITQRARGRLIVMATGAPRCVAERVASHLQLFDRVLASEGSFHMNESDTADQLVLAYGEKGFDYVGNGRLALPLWLSCRTAYCVVHTAFELADGRATLPMGSPRGGLAGALLRAMRPRQWLKNLLVFVPMLSAHVLTLPTLLASMLAFVVFSLCASSAYLLNDALDAHEDRKHPSKRKRPIAAGTLPLAAALKSSALLALGGLALAAAVDAWLLLAAAVYFLGTLAYSLYLKRLLMVDIVVLAMLYTIRLLGGAASTHIRASFWLLAFSFFIFLSLALLKRHSELINMQRAGEDKRGGRGYLVNDSGPIGILGVNSGLLSVLIFMLYFNTPNVVALYGNPTLLLAIVPLLMFWLGRLWLLSYRGEVNEDPVLYLTRDPISLTLLGACLLVAALASI